jgi:general secretion pathway protein A
VPIETSVVEAPSVETPAIETPAAPSYGAFYDLAETPFALSSDPRFFYPSASHAHVLNSMLEAIHSAEGLIVLTAPEGFGKTTIGRMAERDLDRRTLLALVLDPPQTIEELLQTVLADFGVVSRAAPAGAPRLDRDVLASTLASFLKSLVTLKANAVIVIDEAHRVPAGVLTAAADLVASLESPRQLQLVLAGEPALSSIVKRAGLRAPAGRTGINVELRPLDDEEIAPYVRHRLRVADSRARVDFSPAAIGRLYLASRGIPREINRLCERALVDGANRQASVIDAALIDRAAEALGLQMPAAAARPAMRRTMTALAFLVLMLAGVAVASWVFRNEANRVFQQWLEIPAARPAPAREMPEPIRPLAPPPAAPSPDDNVSAPPRV